MKEKRPTISFPEHLKSFARTLHFHSPSAYKYVRETFLKCLPCVQTLNSWICSKNYKPGISIEMVKHVSNIVRDQLDRPNKKLIFNLTFDKMHIKKSVSWNKNTKEWVGTVDTGGQLSEKNESNHFLPVTKALVFMIININGHFKAPVTYYLVNSLNGHEKAILLKDLLINLNRDGIDVVSTTFDGDSAHKTACELLGTNFDLNDNEKLEPYIDHPSTGKYFFRSSLHVKINEKLSSIKE